MKDVFHPLIVHSLSVDQADFGFWYLDLSKGLDRGDLVSWVLKESNISYWDIKRPHWISFLKIGDTEYKSSQIC